MSECRLDCKLFFSKYGFLVTNEEDDILDVLACFIEEKRDEIIEEFKSQKELNKSEFKFKISPSNGKNYDHDWGDCRHHIGIDITSETGNKYFIGFTGLNYDSDTRNIHSSIGRVQLFIGDGNPNKDIKMMSEIKYPSKKDNTMLEVLITKKYDDHIVLNTGYRICGNKKTGDKLLNNTTIADFCKDVIQFIEGYEDKKRK